MNNRLLDAYFRIMIFTAIIENIIKCWRLISQEIKENKRDIERMNEEMTKKISEVNDIKLRVDDLFR